MILCGWPIKKLPLSGNYFASSPLRARGRSPGGGGRRAQGGIVGEGVGECGGGGSHRASPLMNGAFLERTQSPIHRSPRGTSLNKYGQGFSPSGSHRCQSPNANTLHKEGLRSTPPHPRRQPAALLEARAEKCRCGSKSPRPKSFPNSWKDGEEERG